LLSHVSARAENSTEIPPDILDTYENFRHAISTKNINKFESLYYLTPGLEIPDQETFDKYWEDILAPFPDLRKLNIVNLEQNQDCYGIVFLEEYEGYGEEWVDISLIRLKKINNKWRVHSKQQGVAFKKFGTKEDVENKIKKEINENENLKPNC
jgi:hypothetical protein